MKTVFADTSYYVALFNGDDDAHVKAMAFTNTFDAYMMTTDWVLAELANLMSAPANRTLFVQFAKELMSNPRVTVVPADRQLFLAGMRLYGDRSDKGWSLTDCTSFVVMREHGISDALTTDRHFQQAQFNALLVR